MRHRSQRGGEEPMKDFLDMANFKYVWDVILKPNILEEIRLLPDSLVVGSFLLALLTMSFPMSIFTGSLLEAGLIGGGLKSLFSYFDLMHTAPLQTTDPSMCVSGYKTPTVESLLSFSPVSIKSAVPSFPMFFLATASSYVVSSMYSQSEELTALGPSYSSRYYIAIIATTLFMFIAGAYRISVGCEGFGVIAISLFLGLILGALLVFQNNALFGRDSTNLTGIPLLRERTRDGKPLYVCPQRT